MFLGIKKEPSILIYIGRETFNKPSVLNRAIPVAIPINNTFTMKSLILAQDER